MLEEVQEIAVLASDCPQCHDRRTLEIVSVTAFRIWIHCQSCGHVWSRSPLGYAVARFVASLREGERPAPAPVENPTELPPASEARPMLLVDDLPQARGSCTVEDIEAWLCQGDGESAPRVHAPDDVARWLECDPFGGTPLEPALREEVNEEFFLPRLVRPTPTTFAERLDAFHDGLVRLQEFVANYTRREEAEAQRAMLALGEAAATAPATHRKKAPVLRFKAS